MVGVEGLITRSAQSFRGALGMAITPEICVLTIPASVKYIAIRTCVCLTKGFIMFLAWPSGVYKIGHHT